MEISSSKVLNKMEELIKQAKTASTYEKKQSYVLAIKSLCELMTEEETPNQMKSQPKLNEASYVQVAPTQSVEVMNQKPISMDEANGTSLLDF